MSPKNSPGGMEDCSAMHKCWTMGLLHRQNLLCSSAKAQTIWGHFRCDYTLHFLLDAKNLLLPKIDKGQ